MMSQEFLPHKAYADEADEQEEALRGEAIERALSSAKLSSEEAAERASRGVPELGQRTDLRHLDFVTIDGEEARDFDDAVWAMPDKDPRNEGGWRLIVAVADVFDALTHKRCYKDAWPPLEALAFIQAQRGRHFDPQLVDLFSNHFQLFCGICEQGERSDPLRLDPTA